MLEWIRANDALLWWLGSLSVATFIGCLIAIPIIVVRMPEDYFARPSRRLVRLPAQHPVLRGVLIGAKNVLGFIFVLAGIAMLVLPGQGILTILIGLGLMDFPGKFALERRIVHTSAVLRSINWMRARWKRPPLRFDVPPKIEPTASDEPASS
jgi:hypothetical protein